MDEEELNERQQQSLQAHADYDTFGSTAAEMARKRAATEAAERGTALPSLVPTDLIAPVAESVGACGADAKVLCHWGSDMLLQKHIKCAGFACAH